MSVLDLPKQIFHPYRIMILDILYDEDKVSFAELKLLLKLTDGNLGSHLRSLENIKMIKHSKKIEERKVKTYYKITKKGNKLYDSFLDNMFDLICHYW